MFGSEKKSTAKNQDCAMHFKVIPCSEGQSSPLPHTIIMFNLLPDKFQVGQTKTKQWLSW